MTHETILIIAASAIAGFAIVWRMMTPHRPPDDGDDGSPRS